MTITPTQGTMVSLNVDLANGTTFRVNSNAATTLNALQTGMRAEARYQVTSNGNQAISLNPRNGES